MRVSTILLLAFLIACVYAARSNLRKRSGVAVRRGRDFNEQSDSQFFSKPKTKCDSCLKESKECQKKYRHDMGALLDNCDYQCWKFCDQQQ
ncbi:hypothetical protein AKO1_015157 [Acrasis kona]|uniref:Uncharacterized protein n=1 Tax=Acrasis kona TaxID=1008807 RepID=A0AAW2ZMJ0_9EUKA